MIARLRRDPGLALLWLALVLALAIYAPTLGRGLVDHDDPWLVRENPIVQDASWTSVRTIVLDTSRPTRAVLGAEYLPVRDLSIMADFALWSRWWPGFHVTNVVLYLAAIALWFAALVALGLPRVLVGVAVLVWAVHPAHAESVAWISERKGLLAIALTGACAVGYARFRAGGSARWLVLAAAAAGAAVWSKAPAAFAIASLAPLELVVPAARVSWRRSVGGLAAIAAVAAAAFVPVVIVALEMAVVGGADRAPAGWLATVVGVHGFDLRLGLLAVTSSPTYPIAQLGPSALDLVVGALGLAAAAVALAPRLAGRRVPSAVRAASIVWLFGWLPTSRLLLPPSQVLVADRYLMFGTLGLALACAALACALPGKRTAAALVAAIALAAGLRALGAQASWRDSRALWERGVAANPHDGEAWARYASQLDQAGDHAGEVAAVQQGLEHVRHPRLVRRAAIDAFRAGDLVRARALLLEAAEAGEPLAASDLALLLASEGQLSDALAWARRAVAANTTNLARPYGVLAQIALAAGHPDEAAAAAETALRLEPGNVVDRLNLARARLALHRE